MQCKFGTRITRIAGERRVTPTRHFSNPDGQLIIPYLFEEASRFLKITAMVANIYLKPINHTIRFARFRHLSPAGLVIC